MLQYPTNFKPQNIAVDHHVDRDITFTFNGDLLLCTWVKIWDLESGQFIVSSPPVNVQINQNIRYNGETAQHKIPWETPYGRDYIAQVMLMQGTVDSEIYDMYALSGELQPNASMTNQEFYIEDNIKNIYEWNEVNGERKPLIVNKVDLQAQVIGQKVVSGMMIEINTERHLISSYNPTTGKVVVDEPFSFNLTANMQYRIYKNYLITPQYSFGLKTAPSFEVDTMGRRLSQDITTGTYHLSFDTTGTYTQQQGDLVNKYNVRLYLTYPDDTTMKTLIAESGDIYSQDIGFAFYDFFAFDDMLSLYSDTYVEYEITSASGQTITVGDNIRNAVDNEYNPILDSFDLEQHDNVVAPSYISTGWEGKQFVSLLWFYEDSDNRVVYCELYRRYVGTENWEFLDYQLMANGGYFDYTVPNRCNVEYMLVPYLDAGGTYISQKGIAKKSINVNMDGYTISGLIPRTEDYPEIKKTRKKIYSVGEQWKFVGDIQDTTETQNINRETHIGYSQFPKIIDTQNDYLTGKLTAMLGYPDCQSGVAEYKDDAYMMNKWREFVKKYELYLLKTAKGGVYIVKILNSEISTTENISPLPLEVSFDWIECESVKNVWIRS